MFSFFRNMINQVAGVVVDALVYIVAKLDQWEDDLLEAGLAYLRRHAAPAVDPPAVVDPAHESWVAICRIPTPGRALC